jgi:hypothetical protein
VDVARSRGAGRLFRWVESERDLPLTRPIVTMEINGQPLSFDRPVAFAVGLPEPAPLK